jgi:hypothetical protein
MAFVKHTRAEEYEVVENDGEKIASLEEARSAEEEADRRGEAESPSPSEAA